MEGDKHPGPLNLGNPDERTIISVAQTIIALTNSASKIIHLPLPENDPLSRKPDISLAGEILNWKPKMCFEEGIKMTINYFRKNYNL